MMNGLLHEQALKSVRILKEEGKGTSFLAIKAAKNLIQKKKD
jgi:hypothetical protein